MRILRQIRNLFRRDYMKHDHPTREGTLMPTIGQMERIQRGEQARIFHAKYIGCRDVTEKRLLPGEGEKLAHSLLKSAPRKNKRRVTLTFTPENVYVTDMIYRCGLTMFGMDEIHDIFVDVTHKKVFGFVLKDHHTNQMSLYLYKSSVKDYSCETLEILQVYLMMKEKYTTTTCHDPLNHMQQQILPHQAHQCSCNNQTASQPLQPPPELPSLESSPFFAECDLSCILVGEALVSEANDTEERIKKDSFEISTVNVLTRSTSEVDTRTVSVQSPANSLTRSLSSPSLPLYVCDEIPQQTPINSRSADLMASNEQKMMLRPFLLSQLSTEQTCAENVEMKKYGEANFAAGLDSPPATSCKSKPPRRRIHPSILKIVKELEQVQHPYCSISHFSPPELLDSGL